MASIDHLILKVNDLQASVSFCTAILGFSAEGTDGPFTVLRAGPDLQLQLARWGTPGFEHCAFAVSRRDFHAIFDRLKAAQIDTGTCSRSGRMRPRAPPQRHSKLAAAFTSPLPL